MRTEDAKLSDRRSAAANGWADNDLTAIGHGPNAVTTPAIVVTDISGEPTVVRALYRTSDNHVHELSYTSERSWADNDLTAIGHGPDAVTTPAIVVTDIPGEPTVVRALYRSFDNHVHELSYVSDRSWADNDLTALAGGPGAAENPAIVVTDISGEPTVVRALYRTFDDHVHELSYAHR